MKKKKKKQTKKLNVKKVILFLLVIGLILYFCIKADKPIPTNLDSSNIKNSSGYAIIKLDDNKNYSGTGQEKVENKDGYFTTFTTEEKNQKTYKEYKQNGDSSWSDKEYWGGTMAENGCGITSYGFTSIR